jgi:type I restriction enzyme M protein
VDRRGEVLFIDAREFGYMVDRAERALSDEDIARIADTYHAWRGTRSAAAKHLTYEDVPGFCRSVTLDEVEAADYVLIPGRHVGAVESEVDDEPIDEKIHRLQSEVIAAFDESMRLQHVVRDQLGRVYG